MTMHYIKAAVVEWEVQSITCGEVTVFDLPPLLVCVGCLNDRGAGVNANDLTLRDPISEI